MVRKRIAIAVLAGALAVPAAPAAAAPAPRVAHRGRLALAVDAPRPAQHRAQPDPRRATTRGDRPWSFRTGKGVFSTPVVGADETVYVGSADTWFYALGPGGTLRWRYKTGEIIDSAPAVARRGGTVTFGSGDEHIYRLRTTTAAQPRRAHVWRFRATRKPAEGQLVNWWEGNVTMGFGGNLFAGNTGGAEYALNPNGQLRWVHPTGNSVWSNAGDRRRRQRLLRLARPQRLRARHRAASRSGQPAAGNFVDLLAGDRPRRAPSTSAPSTAQLYALDPQTGAVRWRFDDRRPRLRLAGAGRRQHASTSPPPTARSTRSTARASCAGATTRATPIRSSPVLGRAPRGGGPILYVGSVERQPLRARRARPAGGAGRTTPPRATRCCATATT